MNGSFPCYLKQKLGLSEVFSGACCGMRVHELMMLLTDTYKADSYTTNMFEDPYWGGLTVDDFLKNKEWQKKYRSAIKNADLITIQFGSNEIFGTYIKYYQRSGEGVSAAMDRAFQGSPSLGSIAAITAATEKFKYDWDFLMNYIFSSNKNPENLDVVVIGAYANAAGKDAQIFFDSVNSYMQYGSAYCNRYAYLDMTEAGKLIRSGDPRWVTSDNCHPTEELHEKIANEIIEILKQGDTCKHTNKTTKGKVTIGGAGYYFLTHVYNKSAPESRSASIFGFKQDRTSC